MDLRTYRAKSLAEALRLVRDDLGPEASVLHTRRIGSAAWRWLVGGEEVEVTASSEVQAPAMLIADSGSCPRADLLDFRDQFRQYVLREQARGGTSIEELASSAPHLAGDGLPTLLDRIGKALAAQQLPTDAIRSLIADLHREAMRQRFVRYRQLCGCVLRLIAEQLSVRGPIRLLPASRRVLAFVGPTGVGKTTTAAKLAAHFHLNEQKRVGLLAADTCRIAAGTQLRTYAQIMNLPMEAVAAAEDIPAALDRLGDREVVLLDTAGCNPRDSAQVRQLAQLLDHAKPDEVCLVLSSASALASAKAACESFARLGAASLVLTKLDEATALGEMWTLMSSRALPVSYLAAGQTVPHDLAPASRRSLAAWIAGPAIVPDAGSHEST